MSETPLALPPRPSVEQLRTQAKEFTNEGSRNVTRAGLRAFAPSARVSYSSI